MKGVRHRLRKEHVRSGPVDFDGGILHGTNHGTLRNLTGGLRSPGEDLIAGIQDAPGIEAEQVRPKLADNERLTAGLVLVVVRVQPSRECELRTLQAEDTSLPAKNAVRRDL